MTESELQTQVADYIRLRYPKVLFHSDFGSGIKLTMGQAIKQKRQNGGRRAWPDMFIAEPVHKNMAGAGTLGINCYGLFIELKKDGTRLRKKNGDWATEHIKEQEELLEELEGLGYKAVFAVGFDEAKKVIDEYLG
jgi:hypothetical protein